MTKTAKTIAAELAAATGIPADRFNHSLTSMSDAGVGCFLFADTADDDNPNLDVVVTYVAECHATGRRFFRDTKTYNGARQSVAREAL